ncbi:unnamed protein product [Cochlearia groenlandica]
MAIATTPTVIFSFSKPNFRRIPSQIRSSPRSPPPLLTTVPLLGGAVSACTWHFFYNDESLEVLVALQAALTVIGNITLGIRSTSCSSKMKKPLRNRDG